ncbi:MAG: hypothetical protein FWG90_05105 [Oscillospiraceae bacterium]|nr:hypothetical protein [Oscillospiraceae bacterium]
MRPRIPVIVPTTETTTTGTSVVFTLPATIVPTVTPPTTFKMPVPEITIPLTGTEEVDVSIGGTETPLVDNFGLLITSQMLPKPRVIDGEYVSPVLLLQYGASGANNVFFVRRGLRPRRTTVNVVTPPVT